MNARASRCAIWRLHAPPSRYERIQPQAKERTAKLPPNRVTFLNGPNRDFPKWRRQPSAVVDQRERIVCVRGVKFRDVERSQQPKRLLTVRRTTDRACATFHPAVDFSN